MLILPTAIASLYQVFNKYTTSDLHYCDCGCICLEDVKKLASKPLRQLEMDDLIAYHGSALYTWGDVAHYKHFLPRIFELYSQNRPHALIDLADIIVKLNYANWLSWDKKEITAIKAFVQADWLTRVNHQTLQIDQDLLESYASFIAIEVMLSSWDYLNEPIGFKNLIKFFYYEGSWIVDHDFMVDDSNIAPKLFEMLQLANQNNKLEQEFFQYADTDPNYAIQLSVVLQLLEVAMGKEI